MKTAILGILLLCSVLSAGWGISIPFERGRGDYALLYDQYDNFYMGVRASQYNDTFEKNYDTPWTYAKIIALNGGKNGTPIDTHYNCKLIAVYNTGGSQVVGYYIYIPKVVPVIPYTPIQLSTLNVEYQTINVYNTLGRKVETITNQKFNMVHQLPLPKGVYVAIGVIGTKLSEYKFTIQ